jgi:hypothetical protein
MVNKEEFTGDIMQRQEAKRMQDVRAVASNDGVRRKEFFEEATKLFDKYCKCGTLETDKDSKTIGSFVGMQEYYYCLNELIDKFA